MVNQDQWRQIEELFYGALDLPSEQRSDFLDNACGGNPELRAEVESLLASSQKTIGFLSNRIDDAVLDIAGPAGDSGARVGPYKLVRVLGEGGMGKVYLAARADDQFEQKVAIKLLHGALGLSPAMLMRFRAERQILANLEHPNIARLLDGGVTENGLPYLVMEYVDGIPADQYCRKHQLTTDQRLALFLKICDAVEYAHKNLVIHRDIKAENTLVTTDGVPKLLDFGIAKLVDSGDSRKTSATHAFMTPECASPEQLQGQTVTTAADVYALGVLLYELLTETRPFRVSTLSPIEAARVICEQTPKQPSLAAAGNTDLPAQQAKAIRGDLDSIILMAMRKEPQRRYVSVSRMADDIRAHLTGYPVIGRADSPTYRLTKFVKRNRTLAAATSLFIIALIGFGIGMGILARRATRQELIAKRETEFLASVFAAGSTHEARGRTVTALDLLDRGSQRIERELSNEPEARASLLQTMADSYMTLGQYDRAFTLADESHRLQASLYGADDPRTAASLETDGKSDSIEKVTMPALNHPIARWSRSSKAAQTPTIPNWLTRWRAWAKCFP